MVATVILVALTATNGATETTVTNLSFISNNQTPADMSLAVQKTYPVTRGNRSYTRQLRLKITVAPVTSCSNWRTWTTSTAVTNVGLRGKLAQGSAGASLPSGVTNYNTAISGDSDFYTWTPASKGQWDSGSYSAAPYYTKYILLQLYPASTAIPGLWAATIYYSYDES